MRLRIRSLTTSVPPQAIPAIDAVAGYSYRPPPLLVATWLSVVAMADDPKQMQSKEKAFKTLDIDADQRLSRSEVKNDVALSAHFAALDADRPAT